ncbi:HdeD family acid-resistance protein [Rhodopila sp.]|uniref:HdeD family acid-resistance protein n=1 Tax=Rhodopila sp. TaxID=2480087 RepID=UPI003D12932F
MPYTSQNNLTAGINRSLHQHWRVFLIEGIVLLILGIAAILVPPLAGIGVTIFVGWLLLIGGVVGIVATVGARQAPGFAWSLLSALAALLVGVLLLWNPLAGLVSLTYVLIAYFVIDGVLSIVYAIEHRREQSGRWGWLVFSGVTDLVIALVIISGAPASFAWALGLLVGIDLIFAGGPLIAMALEARRSEV